MCVVLHANGMSDLHISRPPFTTGTKEVLLSAGISWARRAGPIRAWLMPFCWSVLGIALITWLAIRVGLNILTGGFLYLIVVVLASASGGFWSGTLTSLVAAACMDFFFLPPIFHFDIDDPMD